MGTTQRKVRFEDKLVQGDSLGLFGADDDTESIYPESTASEDEAPDPTVEEVQRAERTEETEEDEEPAKELCVWVKREVTVTVTTWDELDKEDRYRRRGEFKGGYKEVSGEHYNDRGDEADTETETETDDENKFVQGYESSQDSESAYTSSDYESEGCLGIPDCLVCSSVVLYQQERESSSSSSEEELTS